MASTVLHWFRRDLRLADNPALRAAADRADEVIPVFVLSTWRGAHRWTGPKRQHFLCGCLASLAESIEKAGGHLILRRGPAPEALLELVRETGAGAIHAGRAPDPFGRAEEQRLGRLCAEAGLELRLFDEAWLVPPRTLQTTQGRPFRVFTPYARRWREAGWPEPVPAVRKLTARRGLASEPLPTLAHWGWEDRADECRDLPEPGEPAAHRRLNDFLRRRLGHYAATRDEPAADGTSRLSADLRFGTLSIRELAAKARQSVRATRSAAALRGVQSWLDELAWRDFSFQILWHWPEVLDHAFDPRFDSLRWNPARGRKWDAFVTGRTGFPLVDAGVRQLRATGWMPNRVRMVVAMFLTKDLRIHWQQGEAFFLQHLIDGEIASNNGGWQWSAGTGADAAPYFRIQNPWTQARRHDPDGVYIRRWVPELAAVPAKALFAPPRDRRPLAEGYPLPILDHATEREKTLEWFARRR